MNLWVASSTDRRKEGSIVSSLNFKSVVFVFLSLWVEPAYSFLKWGAVCGHLDVTQKRCPWKTQGLRVGDINRQLSLKSWACTWRLPLRDSSGPRQALLRKLSWTSDSVGVALSVPFTSLHSFSSSPKGARDSLVKITWENIVCIT